MLTSNKIIELLNKHATQIKKFGVKRIGLFGSFSRNDQKDDSDIDIVVEFEEGKKTFDNYMSLKIFLEDLFKRKVDLVILESIRNELKPYILAEVKYAARV